MQTVVRRMKNEELYLQIYIRSNKITIYYQHNLYYIRFKNEALSSMYEKRAWYV